MGDISDNGNIIINVETVYHIQRSLHLLPITTNFPPESHRQTLCKLASHNNLKNTYEASAINMINKLHVNKNKISL